MSKIWVYSGHGRPVHLVDREVTTDDGDYLRICISEEMAADKIPVEVEETDLIDNAINTMKILKVENNEEAARKKADAYWAKKKLQRDAIAAAKAETSKASVDIGKIVQDLVEKQLAEERAKLESRRPVVTEVTAPKTTVAPAAARKPKPVKVK